MVYSRDTKSSVIVIADVILMFDGQPSRKSHFFWMKRTAPLISALEHQLNEREKFYRPCGDGCWPKTIGQCIVSIIVEIDLKKLQVLLYIPIAIVFGYIKICNTVFLGKTWILLWTWKPWMMAFLLQSHVVLPFHAVTGITFNIAISIFGLLKNYVM